MVIRRGNAESVPSGQPQQDNELDSQHTTVKALLDDAKNTNFNDPKQVNSLQKTHRWRLTRRPSDPSNEALHELAKIEDAEKDFAPFIPFVRWVVGVEEYRSQLTHVDTGGYTPFNLALFHKNHELVQILLDNVDDATLLHGPPDNLGNNSLHIAIKKSSPFTKLIIQKAEKLMKPLSAAPVKTTNGRGLNSETLKTIQPINLFKSTTKKTENGPECGLESPLHIAVNQNYEPSGSVEQSEVASTEAVTDGEPPALSKPNSKELPHNPTKPGLTRRDTMSGIGTPTSNAKDPKKAQARELPRQVPKSRSFDLLEIVKLLIAADDRVLVDCKDEEDYSPFRARLYHLAQFNDAGTKEDGKRREQLIEGDPIARYIREYCISNFERKDAVTALYEPGKERLLEFDLTGFPSPINSKFLNGLGQVLRFEGFLRYVSLPRLKIVADNDINNTSPSSASMGKYNFEVRVESIDEAENHENEHQSRKKDIGRGSCSLITIFNWLSDQGVKFVREVIVSDEGEPPHSDEAIEICLKDLDVKIWNWQKVDVCSEVILEAAPNVEDVTLCASGNNAVLVGWSGPSGLPKLQNLIKVHLLIRPGLERPSKLNRYLDYFATELKKNVLAAQEQNRKPSKKPDVTYEILKDDESFSSIYTENRIKTLAESPWMKCMKDFAHFLQSIKLNKKDRLEPIRIAVIDDGINMALDIFDGRVQLGESFHQLSQVSGRRGGYYVPSGPHGTLMAQLICEICPNVKLFIAQLEELRGQDGRRSFTEDSAAEAIEWAIRQNVDIISMSWSIDTIVDIPVLETAFENAEKANIVMFCAAIDRGPNVTDQTYPGRSKKCIKIGASTAKGNRLTWVSEKDSDFLAPGEGIQPAETQLWSQQSDPFGSSVSTALAAGLAGVILHCDRLLKGEPKVGKRPKDFVDHLRKKGNMRKVFENLSLNTNRFLEVTEKFPKKVGRDKWDDRVGHNMVWDPVRDEMGTEMTKRTIQDMMVILKDRVPAAHPTSTILG